MVLDQIEKIRKLAAKATKSPWKIQSSTLDMPSGWKHTRVNIVVKDSDELIAGFFTDAGGESVDKKKRWSRTKTKALNDARLLVELKNNLPEILSLVEFALKTKLEGKR